MVKLPEGKVAPSAISPRKVLIYAKPKVGKTTKLSELEDNLIIDFERGSDFLTALKVNVENMQDVEEVLKELEAYKKANGTNKYKYISLDTVDKLEDWGDVEAANVYRKTVIGKTSTVTNITELPQGGGWGHLREFVKSYINRFANVCDRLILVSHLKDKYLGDKAGNDVVAKDINLAGNSK